MPLLLAVSSVACKPPPEPDYEETFTGPFDEVVLATANGRIEVTPVEGDDVTIEFLPSTSDTYTAVEDGGTLTITGVCFGEEEAGCSGGFLVTAPPSQRLRAEADSGEVRLAGLDGVVDVQTSSGEIHMDGLGAAEASLLTGTGAVEASFADVPKSITFDSGSSNLSVAVPAGTYELDLDTLGGQNVSEGITDGDGPLIHLHSGTGAIDLYAAE